MKGKLNYEKIGVYTAMMVAFWVIVSQLFAIKDEIKSMAERLAKTEVKIEHLESR